jgi:plastocyanin
MQIVDNAFVDPTGGRNTAATVTINVGQAVRWQNNGNVLHTVTSMAVPAGAASFDSSSMQSGAFFDHTFTMAGTYTYRCDFHPQEMLGSTVIVQ